MDLPPLPSSTGSIGSALQSEDMKKLLPWLLAGGAGAIAGGAMTAKRKRRGRPDEEGRLSYLARVLGNAALAGGLVVGAGKGLQYGAKHLANAAPSPEGAEPLKSPLSSTIGDLASNPFVAGLSGAGGVYTFNKLPFLGGTHFEDIAKAKAAIQENVGRRSVEALNGLPKADYEQVVKKWNQSSKLGINYDPMTADKNLAQLAGLRPLDHIKGTGRVAEARRALTRLMNTSGGKMFGATRGARIRRGGVFGLAALAPSLAYNYFANQPQE